MYWIWKWLGYKDENKEMIKLYQLEQARDYFAIKTAELKQKHGKGWSKSYAEVPKRLSQKQKAQLKKHPAEEIVNNSIDI